MRHFLQSQAWESFQQALGRQVVSKQGEGWSFMSVIEQPKGIAGRLHRRLYVPYGPTCASVLAFSRALQALKETAKENRAVYLRLEPIISSGQEIDLSKYGGKLNRRPMQPDRTLVLDLTPDESIILSGMSGTNRNLWNTYQKKSLDFRISYDPGDLTLLLDMLRAVSSRKGLIEHNDDYYKVMAKTLFPSRQAGLAIADLNGKPIVAAMFFDDEEASVRYYAHAGSLEEARKIQANSPLLAFLLLDAKRRGLKQFDFHGVAPPNDETHKWAGHSKFKRSFGGVDKEYLGTWEFPVRRGLFTLAQASRKIRS